ncbi:hypothetical protein AVEN_130276-1 [Araneus ventricosus]|uniref:Tc3 transposase DNA binding domain-containing protein n=1 Tax=Araneus ventricosus TaxID=182803 RepID=A0A4Y2FPI0_ARAVE|nr:hypothetical protein AVEN_130276-1 [Araneus ventricosus]
MAQHPSEHLQKPNRLSSCTSRSGPLCQRWLFWLLTGGHINVTGLCMRDTHEGVPDFIIYLEKPQETCLNGLIGSCCCNGSYQDLCDFERGVIIGAREMGHSISEVAMKFGFSRTIISRVYREYRVSGKTSNFRHRCGRKKTLKELDH